MAQALRLRLPGWRARLIFAALLLVFSELIVWQTPTHFSVLEWAGIALVYVALAAAAFDLIERVHANDLFSLLLIAGLYGLANATLISHITTRDLPISLLVRPLAAQPLAFLGALAAFHLLLSGRPTGPLHAGSALVAGLLWGIWVRWLPVVSDEPVPAVSVGTALAVTGIGLVLVAAIALLVRPAAPISPRGWRLTLLEWLIVAAVLVIAMVIGVSEGEIERQGIGVIGILVTFMGMILYVTLPVRRPSSWLATLTPRAPNIPAWLLLVVPFLLAGWAGFSLPGSGDSSAQSDILFGVLTGIGLVWLPGVSIVVGVRSFVQIAREGG
ncbi:MAG TPA: hypothetical protein PKD09_11805 [Aggregatilinea sp.]|uniref:hypothetical protein n=1 Tax=Aggregatilinea sp. TaxID=2806333 RepID=UPI002B99D045|nr:hypothetical protein [Aggregatilinea sp.]HML22326.1 hypothetical protein [Aggregatilinea sp.]